MDIFVKRPVIAIVVSLIFLLAGGFAVSKIAVIEFPQVESTNLSISTAYPGASPDVVQGFITDPIERVAMTVPGVDFVDSTTTAGLSIVTVWLDLNESSADALAELTARLNQIRFELPEDALDPSISVTRSDQPQALMYLTVNSEGWDRASVTDYMARHVQPLMASIDGVQRSDLEGGRDPAMRVWLDPMRLASLNIGADEVFQALSNNNIIAAIGRTESTSQQINLQTNANLQSVYDFEQLVVRNENGALIRLRDVARIELGEDRGDAVTRVDQNTVIFISIWTVPGSNAIDIADEVYKRLDAINEVLPQGLYINIVFDATVYMRKALKEIVTTLLETVALVGLVVLCLMGSFRTALVPLVTIPISILGAIGAIYAVGFTLNLLTILAIVLSVGLVVDDAIVVVENVARHMREGKSRFDAALISSRELFAPIVAMTLTLATVYVPIGFVSGLSGALFQEFAFTLAIAVLISGLVAVTLSPIMSAYVCADKGKESRSTLFVNALFDKARNAYRRVVTLSLNCRAQVVFIGVFLSILIVPLYLFSAKELAPIEDQGTVFFIIESPPESRVQYTSEYMKDVVKVASELPGIAPKAFWQDLSPSVGFSGQDFVDYSERDFSLQELSGSIYEKMSGITGLRVLPVLPGSLPTAGQFDVELVVQSADSYEDMAKYIGPLVDAAYQSGNFTFVQPDLFLDQNQMRLNLDRDRIADLGLNVRQVSAQLSALISDQEVNRFDAGGKSYRVIPMVEDAARHDPRALLDLQLTAPNGVLVPVRSIATLERVTSPRSLGKFNQQRSFRIFGGIHSGTTSDRALTALETAAREILPSTYTIDYAGASRPLRTEGASLVSVLMISMCLIYFLLAVQFNSFRAPLVVLLGSAPLALTGALVFSFFGLTTINVYSQIGFITLVGLVAKNGILITEFANQLQHRGCTKLQAIIESATVRLRPVLMTTMATAIGHFPLVLVTGAGAEARNSIGVILVTGMITGTLFTLFILPSIYMLFGDTIKSASGEEPTEAEIGFDIVGSDTGSDAR